MGIIKSYRKEFGFDLPSVTLAVVSIRFIYLFIYVFKKFTVVMPKVRCLEHSFEQCVDLL